MRTNGKKTEMTLPISELFKIDAELEEPFTHLGIGPMSPLIIKAAFELAEELKFPLFFIASRNQIDSYSLGGGYVQGWNQEQFSTEVRRIATSVGFTGIYYLCRDHGGPWQKDTEFKAGLDSTKATQCALTSFSEDIASGFEFLHVDTSVDPEFGRLTPAALATDRVVSIIESLEEIASKSGGGVCYEASLEESNGDFSVVEEFRRFVTLLASSLNDRGLPLPVYMVGNTGTLTKMNRNIGKFDVSVIKALAKICLDNGMILKEHNADYLSGEVLAQHPYLGIGMANVAPEFGYAETRALLELEEEERFYIESGESNSLKASGLKDAFLSEILKSDKWKKWLTPEMKNMSKEELFQSAGFVNDIVLVNGHYHFSSERVEQARLNLYQNATKMNPNGGSSVGETSVKDAIKASIRRYVESFNLIGHTEKVMSVAGCHADV
ncbi:class II D-tagatose-bisphosphate aldolase, non-catalytic subunit [Gilvimarinus sp. SDUM040013]|uniref:Class II D-tagatose-bisphosphate aldolase, non-catalytic subunit n=1 Tax=Gilvimarinus gilvus TaxID=3058038 RepID=A0ABU4S3C0_9GAMM|nr:class II D-tagatose-bisphosphate aldolase, non-catalytic subunit [Gilvimarinus sp. SDUM040013]MDO3387177.1 class II D-tagatose-bisphosphate aldolase, non-catalytic subunit [Gilvimarinus sp. SDUM040013]MDX6851434.1 class II D-tagatose-bisphosphate aldolase, non-catalytic subunit [Gilvimarinus sp. SDUM040013]